MKEKEVTFTFKCLERQSVELKIRLKYDNLQQTTFFQSLLEMYIRQDPLMVDIVDKIKEEKNLMGKRRRSIILKEFHNGREILEDLGITKLDKQKLFDIIESGDVLNHE